jgi:membrane protease YdiL (CAAX protease family)
MDKIRKYPVIACWLIFMICAVARIVEYFFIRTDKSFLAENFIHKLFGVFLLFVILSISKMKWKDIGFVNDHAIGNCGKGILLGSVCFAVAYGIECLILYITNQNVELEFYVSGFLLNGDTEKQTGILFVLICIAFNIINVWMEEGIFRGLFAKFLENISYIKVVFLIAFLFGVWHWVMPFRDYLEGKSSLPTLLIMGIGYIVLAGIMSIKWSLLYKLTGSLWMGLGDHLFNNVIVTNLVHVISNNEADGMQIVRILIGQLISFTIVLLFYIKNNKRTR